MSTLETKGARVIVSLDRLQNTPSGNPCYSVLFDNGSLVQTKPDAAFVYGLSRYLSGPAEVTFEGGYVTNIEPWAG